MQTPESLTAQEVADALGPLGRPVPPVPLIATWSPAERAAILAWVADWQEAERAELEFEAPPPPPLDAWLAGLDPEALAPLDPWLSATGVRAVSQRQQTAILEAWTDCRYPEAAADHPGTVAKIRARCRAAADDLRRLDQIRVAPTPPPWAEPWLRALANRERPLPTPAALRLGRDALARLSRIVLPPAPPAESQPVPLAAEGVKELRAALRDVARWRSLATALYAAATGASGAEARAVVEEGDSDALLDAARAIPGEIAGLRADLRAAEQLAESRALELDAAETAAEAALSLLPEDLRARGLAGAIGALLAAKADPAWFDDPATGGRLFGVRAMILAELAPDNQGWRWVCGPRSGQTRGPTAEADAAAILALFLGARR